MNPVPFLLVSSLRAQVALCLASLLLIIALPFLAVFSLGSHVLSYLANSAVSAIDSQTSGLYQGAVSKTNLYDWGNCTYWAALLRERAGDPVPNTWGNAATWAERAMRDGYLVNRTPTPGSIMQISNVDYGLGHVAYVTAVDAASGAWTISEMNVKGLDIVDTKSLPASAAAGYNFIHDKETIGNAAIHVQSGALPL